MSLTIQQINSSIMHQDWTNDQLNSMIASIKYARAQLGKDNKRALTVGTNVRFVNRNGQYVTGTVSGIKIKNVIVRTSLGTYRVPANMIETV